MEQPILQQEILIWVIGIAIGLPVLLVALGELAERLAANGNPLAQGVRQARNYVLPLLTLLIILRFVLNVTGYETFVLAVETLFWVVVMVTLLKLVSNLLQLGTLNPTVWVNNVPGIFFAMGRALVALVIIYYVLTNLWGVDVGSLVTAVGIGSIVIALALQDTLSNLLSGFLLIADNPFKTGDMIEVGDELLIVQDVTWRTTRCTSRWDNSLVMIPNGRLGNETFRNHGSPESSRHRMRHNISFSYDDPPNRVSQIMVKALKQIDLILDKPAPKVTVRAYQDSDILYELNYHVSIWNRARCIDTVNRQIYYIAKRHGLTFQYPTQIGYEQATVDLPSLKTEYDPDDIRESLRTLSIFAMLEQTTIDRLVQAVLVVYYGAGESVVREGEQDAGFYVIQSGRGILSVRDKEGRSQQMDSLTPGDFFGGMALLRDEPSPISVTATTDLEVLIIEDQIMADLTLENPQFALEMDVFNEERKKVIASVLNREAGPAQTNGHLPIRLT